jgi:hypothetical protein
MFFARPQEAHAHLAHPHAYAVHIPTMQIHAVHAMHTHAVCRLHSAE